MSIRKIFSEDSELIFSLLKLHDEIHPSKERDLNKVISLQSNLRQAINEIRKMNEDEDE